MEKKFNCLAKSGNLFWNADEYHVEIRSSSGYIICKVIPGDCLYIEQIDFFIDVDGKKMMKALKQVAAIFYELPIEIYAIPQIGESLTEDALKFFLKEEGFELSPDDIDRTLYRWGKIL